MIALFLFKNEFLVHLKDEATSHSKQRLLIKCYFAAHSARHVGIYYIKPSDMYFEASGEDKIKINLSYRAKKKNLRKINVRLSALLFSQI